MLKDGRPVEKQEREQRKEVAPAPERKREMKRGGALFGSSMFRGLQAHLKSAKTNL